MKIDINDHRKIFAIQEEFSNMFPYLKIEFFSKPHHEGAPSPKRQLLSSSKTLGESRVVHKKGIITIQAQMTTGELEQNFADVYGLSVQVFRKSGKSWLETSTTDNWTLEKQNETGKEMESVG